MPRKPKILKHGITYRRGDSFLTVRLEPKGKGRYALYYNFKGRPPKAKRRPFALYSYLGTSRDKTHSTIEKNKTAWKTSPKKTDFSRFDSVKKLNQKYASTGIVFSNVDVNDFDPKSRLINLTAEFKYYYKGTKKPSMIPLELQYVLDPKTGKHNLLNVRVDSSEFPYTHHEHKLVLYAQRHAVPHIKGQLKSLGIDFLTLIGRGIS